VINSTKLNKIKKWALNLLIGWFSVTIIWVLLFRWVDPPSTLTMVLKYQFSGKNYCYDWVDYDNISNQIKLAAIASEDQNFPNHLGFDFEAIGKAVKFNKGHKKVRGASTISQQVAKNVFLWPGRSYIRKAFEAYFTILIELLWSKERILETYLNIAEMGKGIFGVKCASSHYFNKKPKTLTNNEAARIISILPSPLKWSPTHSGPFVVRRQAWISDQMRELGGINYLREL